MGAIRCGLCLALLAGLALSLEAVDRAATANLSDAQIASLASLTAVVPHRLYHMTYVGDYDTRLPESAASRAAAPWACSLLVAGGGSSVLYGRNFDWSPCPILVLHTAPTDGFASVSVVDPTFLFPDGSSTVWALEDLSYDARIPLLLAPALPFDGMNERGVAVGMATVPQASPPIVPGRQAMHSLGVLREILDHASNVEEAIEICGRFNVSMGGGPPIHFLIGDRSGAAVVVEYTGEGLVALRNEHPWLAATNFVLGSAGAETKGRCWRYDTLVLRLGLAGGAFDVAQSMDLLATVSQTNTQWSAVYDLERNDLTLAVDRQYSQFFSFPLRNSRAEGT